MAAQSWQIETKNKLAADWFHFSEHGSEFVLECSRGLIGEILKGVEDINQGRGDYSIGGDRQPLWFWWQ